MQPVPTAEEWMIRPLSPLRADEPVARAVERLVATGRPGLVVVDGHQRVVGVFTEDDCLELMAEQTLAHAPAGRVSAVMSPLTVRVEPGMDLVVVASLFRQAGCSWLPVVDGGELVGELERRQVLRGLQAWLRRHANELTHDRKVAASADLGPHLVEQMIEEDSRRPGQPPSR